MRVAVVGTGQWGMNLVRTLHDLGALGALVETDSEKRKALEKEFPEVPAFDTIDALPASLAVAIATPAPSHFSLARKALLDNRDVFVEKPMALSSVEAREIGKLASERKLVLMVGHLLLYQPAVRWIANFLKEGGLGKLFSLHQERLNLGRARSVENVLWSLGVHDVAVVLDLVGEKPSSVRAAGHAALQAGIEDDFYLHLEFPSGASSHLHVSWLWPERRRQMRLIGEKGMLVYDELEQAVTFHEKTISPVDLKIHDAGSREVFRQAGQPLSLELDHFLARCRDREEPLSGAEQGIAVVEVLEAAAR